MQVHFISFQLMPNNKNPDRKKEQKINYRHCLILSISNSFSRKEQDFVINKNIGIF